MTRLVSLLCACLIAILGATFVLPLDSQSDESAPARAEFAGWPKPDVVLMITGQQHGYIEPCGCTGLDNQKGGLARRDALLQQLTAERGWNVVPLDAGNQVRRIGRQAEQKYQSTINALRIMGYRAIGLGPDDLRLSVGELVYPIVAVTDDQGQSDLFVSANANPLGFVRPFRIVESGGMKIGVTTVVGAAELKRVTQDEITTEAPEEGLRKAVMGIQAAGVDFCVVMALTDQDEAAAMAKQVPGIDLIVAADGVGEPKFQVTPVPGTSTQMIQTGAKGMYVGVVGLYRGQAPRMRYQRVPLDGRFTDSRRILENMKEYQSVLKELGLANLGLKPVKHVAGKFAGSESCGDCHTQAYEKWLETPHAHATTSIAEPTERSEIPRHYDPECLSCHVTGWNPQAYFPYETGYLDLEQSAHLHGNGCENCHGPGLAHVQAESGDGDFTDVQKLKLREQMRLPLEKAEAKCLECHDLDNSPDFHHEGAFEKYWEAVKHPWRD
jgi:hypothetical protein